MYSEILEPSLTHLLSPHIIARDFVKFNMLTSDVQLPDKRFKADRFEPPFLSGAIRVQLPDYYVETIDFVERFFPKYGTIYAAYHSLDTIDTFANDFESVS